MGAAADTEALVRQVFRNMKGRMSPMASNPTTKTLSCSHMIPWPDNDYRGSTEPRARAKQAHRLACPAFDQDEAQREADRRAEIAATRDAALALRPRRRVRIPMEERFAQAMAEADMARHHNRLPKLGNLT